MIIEIALGIVLAVLILRFGGDVLQLFVDNLWLIVGGTLATIAALAILVILLAAPDSFAADVIVAAVGVVISGVIILFARDSYRDLSAHGKARARQLALGCLAALLLLAYLTNVGVIRWSEPVVVVSLMIGAAIWGLAASFSPGQMTRRERGLVAGVCGTLLAFFPAGVVVALVGWYESDYAEVAISGTAIALGLVAARYARNTAGAGSRPVVRDVSSL